MNVNLLTAGLLTILLGAIHSILGEYLIFKDKRKNGSLVPNIELAGLKERHVRIIWATWHFATVFGWCIGAILIVEAYSTENELITLLIAIFNLLSATLVLVATKGRHPGWIVLTIIGALVLIG